MYLSKGLVTNKVKTDPYLDYKEFYKMEKEKQEKEKQEKERLRNEEYKILQ